MSLSGSLASPVKSLCISASQSLRKRPVNTLTFDTTVPCPKSLNPVHSTPNTRLSTTNTSPDTSHATLHCASPSHLTASSPMLSCASEPESISSSPSPSPSPLGHRYRLLQIPPKPVVEAVSPTFSQTHNQSQAQVSSPDAGDLAASIYIPSPTPLSPVRSRAVPRYTALASTANTSPSPCPPSPARSRAVPRYTALASTANTSPRLVRVIPTPPGPRQPLPVHPFFARVRVPPPSQPRLVADYQSTSESQGSCTSPEASQSTQASQASHASVEERQFECSPALSCIGKSPVASTDEEDFASCESSPTGSPAPKSFRVGIPLVDEDSFASCESSLAVSPSPKWTYLNAGDTENQGGPINTSVNLESPSPSATLEALTGEMGRVSLQDPKTRQANSSAAGKVSGSVKEAVAEPMRGKLLSDAARKAILASYRSEGPSLIRPGQDNVENSVKRNPLGAMDENVFNRPARRPELPKLGFKLDEDLERWIERHAQEIQNPQGVERSSDSVGLKPVESRPAIKPNLQANFGHTTPGKEPRLHVLRPSPKKLPEGARSFRPSDDLVEPDFSSVFKASDDLVRPELPVPATGQDPARGERLAVKPTEDIAPPEISAATVRRARSRRGRKQPLDDLDPSPLFSSRSPLAHHFSRPPNIVYTTDPGEADDLVGCLRGDVLGLDLEWPIYASMKEKVLADGTVKHVAAPVWVNRKPNFPQGKTAVIQICDQRTVIVFHLMNNVQPGPAVLELLQDPARHKVGVNIKYDGAKLVRDFGTLFPSAPAGLVELSHMVRLVDPGFHAAAASFSGLVSLNNLAKQYLGHKLDKDPNVRCSRWNNALSEEQKQYAANDVFASLLIFNEIMRRADTQGLERGHVRASSLNELARR